MTDTLTIDLKEPLAFHGDTLTELKLREPTALEFVKALDAGGDNGARVNLSMLSQQLALPIDALGKMALSDYTQAAAFLAPFLRLRATTSDAPSPISPGTSDGDPGTAGA